MEKVIYGLETQLDDLQKYADNDQPLTLAQEQAKEIISLLKEQESVIEALKSDLDETLAVLSEQPEIVRCRECKYGCLMANGKVYMCESPEQNKKICVHVHKQEWFCADGERR